MASSKSNPNSTSSAGTPGSVGEQEEPSGSNGSNGPGNTNGAKRSRVNAGKHWVFTWNNYPSDAITTLKETFSSNKLRYVFQQERGEEGTPHLQGYVCCTEGKMRPVEKLKLPTGIHWEKCRDVRKSIDYCHKDDTRDGEIFTNMDLWDDTPPVLSRESLNTWQRQLLDLVSGDPDPRRVLWIYDEQGNTGKTYFAHFLCGMSDNVIFVNGKGSDILYAFAAHKATTGRFPKYVLYGVPRSSAGFFSYSSLEQLKDGIFFSGKYESAMCRFATPHVVVLCNQQTEWEKLSRDRWRVFKTS